MTNPDSTLDRRELPTALVVTEDPAELAELEHELLKQNVRVIAATSFLAARASLSPDISLLIVDAELPGAGTVPQLLRAARRIAPIIECVVIGSSSQSVPRTARAHCLVRPIDPQALSQVIEGTEATRRAIRSITTLLVGRVGLKEAQRVLRAGMSRAALARCAGSRRAAAVLLGVDRRYVQKLCAASEQGMRLEA